MSGIARASVRLADGSWQGRWGRTKIIQMLKGAKTQELLRTSLVRLSTYGILSRWSEDDIRQLFRAMQMAGLTRMSGEADRPLITLSPKGNEVMMGRKQASLVWPFARRGKISVSMEQARVRSTGNLAALGEFDEDLFLKLKELRNELAREAGIPAYAVFHNSTLEGLARLKPTTFTALESRKLLVTWMISWKSLPSIAGCEFVFPICSNQAYAVSGMWCSC